MGMRSMGGVLGYEGAGGEMCIYCGNRWLEVYTKTVGEMKDIVWKFKGNISPTSAAQAAHGNSTYEKHV